MGIDFSHFVKPNLKIISLHSTTLKFYFCLNMKKYVLFYGLLAFSMLMLFQLSSLAIFKVGASRDWILLVVAVVSIGIGIFYSKAQSSKNQIAEVSDTENLVHYSNSGLTEREYEVLELLNLGFSNKEVGEKLFISENTVKTHVSNLLLKLNAKRRTQAIKNAKDLKIIS